MKVTKFKIFLFFGFLALMISFHLFKDFLAIKYFEFRIKNVITSYLIAEHPDYINGEFWSASSEKMGSALPPYYIHHIYSENGKDFILKKFTFNNHLEFEEIRTEDILSFNETNNYSEPKSTIARGDIVFELAKREIDKENIYSGILMLQEAIKYDSSLVEAVQMKNQLVKKIKK